MALGLMFGAMFGTAQAQDFPTRPVTLIVPYAAGGTTDIGLRALASATESISVSRSWSKNRAGVGGVLGPMQMASGSKPDGYTISQVRSPCSAIRSPARLPSIRSPT